MTALGKILAIFVLLLALVWLGLGMTAHVTRTNWKLAFDQERAAHAKTITAANQARTELDSSRKAYDAQIAVLTNEKTTLKKQVETLEGVNQKNDAANQAVLTQLSSQASANSIAQANLTQANTQNDILAENTVRLAKEKDDALTGQKKAEADALSLRLEADGIKKQNDRYQNQLIAAKEQLRDIQTGANRAGAARVVPVPDGIRGTVDKVSGEFVSISLGADAMVREGAVLDVVRYGATPVYLGTLTITQVSTKESVGQFASKDGPTAKGDALPKSGDVVLKIR